VKKMFHSKRIWITLVYILTLTFTLVCAFVEAMPARALFLIICIIVQFITTCLYTISYIPGGMTAVYYFLGACCGCSESGGGGLGV
jgi:hypothetical protein